MHVGAKNRSWETSDSLATPQNVSGLGFLVLMDALQKLSLKKTILSVSFPFFTLFGTTRIFLIALTRDYRSSDLIPGTIPSEIGLLTDLAIWGMERGNLTSTIPTEVGLLTNLVFLDLDYNQLTGSLTTQLLSLSSLTQLDLNNNELTGSINGIGVFPDMEFLQIHDNFFTGTVPEAVGSFSNLAAFTLHETEISGSMPGSVCDLLLSEENGGVLTSLIADCETPNPDIVCECCTDCRDT